MKLLPDYLYIGKGNPTDFAVDCPLLVDADCWQEGTDTFPVFSAAEMKAWTACSSAVLKFIRLTYSDLTDEVVTALQQDRATVVLLETHHVNGVGEQRAAIHRLMTAGCDVPVILFRTYDDADAGQMQLKAAADLGTLLLDGFADGVMLQDHAVDAQTRDRSAFGILQATRLRISRTEYISCPSCGRTLYDMQTTIARIKAATSHLKGLKIGIMGCIVNGPGEMADADYGYVGAGRGRISLYKGKQCVLKNIPEEEAVDRLVELIKENGDWK